MAKILSAFTEGTLFSNMRRPSAIYPWAEELDFLCGTEICYLQKTRVTIHSNVEGVSSSAEGRVQLSERQFLAYFMAESSDLLKGRIDWRSV